MSRDTRVGVVLDEADALRDVITSRLAIITLSKPNNDIYNNLVSNLLTELPSNNRNFFLL